MLTQLADDWVRRWRAIGTVRCNRHRGLVVINRPYNDTLAMPLLDELGRTPGLQRAVADLVAAP